MRELKVLVISGLVYRFSVANETGSAILRSGDLRSRSLGHVKLRRKRN